MKVCRKCGEEKPLDQFQRMSASSDGHQYICAVCMRARCREWQKKNNEKKVAYNLAWRAANPDLARAREDRRKEKYPHRSADWYRAHPEVQARKGIIRLTRKEQATVSWADSAKIAEYYRLSKALTKANAFGTKWHVDHIVPLQGKNVCGLHVHSNLRIIPALANISKGNKHLEV